ncbi:hypothetical protein [Chryseobacterium jejuense]|uniref:Uncharacterized protein n=1 Tax=Chryseobacterium jejuense TaxID=445960 RepID=A0A2X2VJM5_CHRJE|nr:hypothetical protein [Chryseobacterium jejuense]SQB28808.1 Uncharacterised protein [Chryseobacterium jejuense]
MKKTDYRKVNQLYSQYGKSNEAVYTNLFRMIIFSGIEKNLETASMLQS